MSQTLRLDLSACPARRLAAVRAWPVAASQTTDEPAIVHDRLQRSWAQQAAHRCLQRTSAGGIGLGACLSGRLGGGGTGTSWTLDTLATCYAPRIWARLTCHFSGAP